MTATKQYGAWILIGRAKNSKSGHTMLNVRCICGTERAIRKSYLEAGRSRSCGCANRSVYSEPALELRVPPRVVQSHATYDAGTLIIRVDLRELP